MIEYMYIKSIELFIKPFTQFHCFKRPSAGTFISGTSQHWLKKTLQPT